SVTANNQLAYWIDRPASGFARFSVSSNGTDATVKTVESTVKPRVGRWEFLVARFTPSTELALFLSGKKDVNTSSIPATLWNSSSPFTVGAYGGSGTSPMDGRAAFKFLCAAAVDDGTI